MGSYLDAISRRPTISALEIARLAGEDAEPNNPLYNVGKFLSRPLYAVTSALSGEFGDAAKNLGQMALDFPTGGFINRNLSLANLVDETGDITRKEARPEATDLMQRWGLGKPSSTLGRLGVDIVGGMLLDPLTYVSFGTSGLAKGALKGASRGAALETLLPKLGRLTAGREALAAEKALLAPRIANAERLAQVAGRELSPARRRAYDLLAAEGVLRRHGGLAGKLTGELDQGVEVSRGIARLIGKEMLEPPTGIRLNAPFVGDIRLPGITGETGIIRGTTTLPRLRALTAPWLGKNLLKAVSPAHGELVEAAAESGWNYVKGTLGDRTLLHMVPEGVRQAVRAAGHARAGADVEARDLVRKLWGGFSDTDRKAIKEAWDEAGETVASWKAETAERQGVIDAALDPAVRRNAPAGFPGFREQLQPVTDTPWLERFQEYERTAPPPRTLDEVKAAARENALQKIEAGGVDRAAAEKALDAYDASMKSVQNDLVKLGVWKKRYAKEFYVPHQSVGALSELMSAIHGDSDLIKGARALFKDQFTKARKFKTVDEFREALRAFAEKNNLGDLQAHLDNVLDEQDIGKLHLDRLVAHNKTVQHRTLWQKAKHLWKADGKIDKNVARYLNSQLDTIKSRGAVQAFLGGGTWKVPMSAMSPAMEKLAMDKGWKVKDGIAHVKFPGINSVYKPFLTTHPANAGFHFRNTLGSLIMGFTDPDIGWKGVNGMIDALGEYPLIRRLKGWEPSEAGKLLAAARGDEAALKAIPKDKMIGRYSAREVIGHLRRFLGERISPSDLMENIGKDPFSVAQPAFKDGPWQWYKAIGENWANRTEGAFRANAYLALLDKGVPPAESIERVGKAFVDYKINSATERALRDVFPFARFAFGSAAWLKAYAKNPKLVTPLARLQQSSATEGEILPESVRGGLAIPFGKDAEGQDVYLSSLGLPQESAFGLLDAGTSFEGMRRSGLGMIHPLLKAPLEQATNRNFFFGGEAGEYRNAPAHRRLLGLTQEIETPTGVREEVPGGYNDFVGATPVSRLSRYADVITDERKTALDKVLRLGTGLRTVTSDRERVARRALADAAEREVDRGRLYKIPAYGPRKVPGKKTPEELDRLLDALRQTGSKKKKQEQQGLFGGVQ